MSHWDAKTAEWYAAKYGEYATNRLAIDALVCDPPTTVLDVGCGTGAALRHASIRWAGARFVGLDPVLRMIEIAQERLAGHPQQRAIEFRVATAEAIPAVDSTIDLLLAFDSMDHWNDVETGVREVKRVLALGGRLVIVKDQGVPGDRDRVDKLFTADGKLMLESFRRIRQGAVAFTMWVFAGVGEQT